MPKTLLVTGASGFVAQHLIPKLAKRGYRLNAVVRKNTSKQKLAFLAKHNCNIFYADLRKSRLDKIFEGVTAIIHLAAVLNEDGLHRTYSVNTRGTLNLAKEAHMRKIKFIHLSILSNADNRYVRSRCTAEKIVKKLDNYTILQSSLILGEGAEFVDRLKKTIRYKYFPVSDKGQHILQPIYVGDVVKFVIRALENKNTKNKTYKIAGPQDISFADFVLKFARKSNKQVKIVNMPGSILKIPINITDKLMAKPPITQIEMDLLTNPETIYSQKSAHQLGVKLTNIDKMLDMSLHMGY